MKILLLGEYSNVHWTLAEGLRQLGHEVTVVSNGDFWKDYPRDLDVSRPSGCLSGLRLMARILSLLPRLRGYDVVQLINPIFFELKAEHLFPIYRYLRRHNRKMVLGAFGMDYYWVSVNTNERPLRYSDFNIGDHIRHDEAAERERRDWIGTAKERLNRMIAQDCDAIVTGLYEYQATYGPLFPSKTRFIPFPIMPMRNAQCAVHNSLSPRSLQKEMEHIPPSMEGGDRHQPLILFIGISRERSAYKGTDIMLHAAQAIKEHYPDRIELRIAEGVPFATYQHMMDGADAILDQLYSYTPSMNPLLAMSKGIICIGGGEPENYEILDEDELRPIINVQPTYESVYTEIENLLLHPELLPRLKQESITYIHRHHDYLKVAKQYEELYSLLINK